MREFVYRAPEIANYPTLKDYGGGEVALVISVLDESNN